MRQRVLLADDNADMRAYIARLLRAHYEVMAQADLLCEELGSHPLREQAAEIIQAAERCVGIVRNFLTLAHQHTPQRTRVEFNALISEAMKLLSYPLQVDTIDVRQHLANDLPPL